MAKDRSSWTIEAVYSELEEILKQDRAWWKAGDPSDRSPEHVNAAFSRLGRSILALSKAMTIISYYRRCTLTWGFNKAWKEVQKELSKPSEEATDILNPSNVTDSGGKGR